MISSSAENYTVLGEVCMCRVTHGKMIFTFFSKSTAAVSIRMILLFICWVIPTAPQLGIHRNSSRENSE